MGLCSPVRRGLLYGEHVCTAPGIRAWKGKIDSGIRAYTVEEDTGFMHVKEANGWASTRISVGVFMRAHRDDTCDIACNKDNYAVDEKTTTEGRVRGNQKYMKGIWCPYTQTQRLKAWICGINPHSTLWGILSTKDRYVIPNHREPPLVFVCMKSNIFRPVMDNRSSLIFIHNLQAKSKWCFPVRFYSHYNQASCKEDTHFDVVGKFRGPWNVMFFGTDDFATQSLKILNKYRLVDRKNNRLINRL
ncbi:uncharacterized protein LOC128663312 [Bombina bombina]|uniref:uncharacterized protein LOC128663312 n=1 Tax=Bombina bombina TaxID=8345 RepID=UPI00235B2075|nr:uncharacterized protein LOC128663312 [Bombina bombina]